MFYRLSPGGYGMLETCIVSKINLFFLFNVLFQSLGIMRYFPEDHIQIKIRLVDEEIIDRSHPTGYFDGEENRDLRHCRASGNLYFSDNHWYSFKASLREGSSNFVQLSALRILLRLAVEHEALNLQIYGDSQIIIKWITSQNKIHYVQLIMLLDEVH